MSYTAENIFDLVDPSAYGCRVASYHRTHSTLLIVAAHPERYQSQIIHLNFLGVMYFEGPMKWQGADFCLETTDECAKLLQKLGEDVDLYLKRTSLYVVELPNLKVKILAKRGNKTEHVLRHPEGSFD